MSFNISKCVVIKCSKSPSIISFNYLLNGYLLDTKTEHTYLGITLQNMMSWASHINSIVNKASRTLNFLKRNLSRCSQKVKESAYFTTVCPILNMHLLFGTHASKYISTHWKKYTGEVQDGYAITIARIVASLL